MDSGSWAPNKPQLLGWKRETPKAPEMEKEDGSGKRRKYGSVWGSFALRPSVLLKPVKGKAKGIAQRKADLVGLSRRVRAPKDLVL